MTTATKPRRKRSEASLAKQRATQAVKKETRLVQAREQIDAFRAWLVVEREAFEHRARLAETVGRENLEWIVSDICWRDAWNNKPEVPPDSAWRELRGEIPHDEE